jgi:hypothetical protein
VLVQKNQLNYDILFKKEWWLYPITPYLGKMRLNKNNNINTVTIVTITIDHTLYLGALKNFSSVYVKKRTSAVIIGIPQNNE